MLTPSSQTYYNFEKKFGWGDASFIIHPDHFFVREQRPMQSQTPSRHRTRRRV